MWEEAARWPAAVRPPLNTTIGFDLPIRLASARKRSGSGSDSRYSMITRVASCRSHASSRSLTSTSALLPSETKCEKPRPTSRAASSIATPTAPEWEPNATAPGSAGAGVNDASMRTSLAVLITPMQLGPIIRTPAARTRPSIARSTRAPASPPSRKPAVMTTRPPTPTPRHSSIAAGTASRGTITTARSGGPGSASRFG